LENRENSQPDPELEGRAPEQAGDVEAAPRPPEGEPTVRQWLAQNVPLLAIVVALVLFFHYQLGWDLGTIAKVALGLGFIIFIHELGHFLVAKWCDVHVQVFSIGFGPALPGCKFNWGETTYKLALIPLGGYVQMVGQVDGDESSDGSEDDPRSYRNKSVWQRMAIISAGVTMNAILAVVCFVVVFLGPGKDREAGVVGPLDTGGAAFQAGVRMGDKILDVGGIRDPYFEQLKVRVMATTSGERLRCEFAHKGPSGALVERTLEIEPRVEPGELSRPMLGIAPARRLTLAPRRYVGHLFDRPAYPGTPAARASSAFEFGDQIIATTDPDDPSRVTDLPKDWRKVNNDGEDYQRDYFAFARRLRRLAGKEVTIRVLRGRPGDRRKVDITVPAAFHNVLGARMLMGQVTVVRDRSPAATDPANRVHPRDPVNHLEGDVIEKVEVTDSRGKKTTYAGPGVAGGPNNLDPERLPDQLRAWADELARAKVPDNRWVVTLHLRRHNEPGNGQTNAQYKTVVVRLPWQRQWTYEEALPMGLHSPLAIPELGLAYLVKTTVAAVDPRLAGTGEDALQPGDVIEKVLVHYRGKGDEIKDERWTDLEPDTWARTFERLQEPPLVESVTLGIKRNNQPREIKLQVKQDPTWPLAERGLVLDTDLRLQKAQGVVEAIGMGLEDTRSTMLQVFQNLRGMMTRRISPKTLGGPVTIARVAYSIATVDFWEFIFFLGLISINLAVINFLPIPVLDGGHMVFLLYEKLRGKPASEQVRIGATYAGLLVLASLMIFVLYLDISRMFKG
jgi:regulator of sigma E protease